MAWWLIDTVPFIPTQVQAAYVERTKPEDDSLLEAVAIVLGSKRLHLFEIKQEGPRNDEQTETVMQCAVALEDVSVVETQLQRHGWGRSEGERHMEDKVFEALIHFRVEAGSFGDSVRLPYSEESRFDEGAARRARAFAQVLMEGFHRRDVC